MAEYSKISQGTFTSTAATAHFINLAYKPISFEIWNKTQWGSTSATPQVKYAIGFAEDVAGTAYTTQNTTSAATDESIALTSGGFSFITADTPRFGPVLTISSITQAAAAVVTTGSNHNLTTGDVVWIYGTTGMLQIAGAPYVVTVTAPTTFTIPVNSAGFAAAATAGFCKQVLYPDLYIPFNTIVTAIGLGVSTTITTSVNHEFVVGQEVNFVIPEISASVWGTTELNGIKGFVTSIPALNQIVVNINSSAFTAFAYPTSAVAALGMTFPQVIPVGDANTGYSGPIVPLPQTIPGAFAANTRQGVIIGASLLLNSDDEIHWRAEFPDQVVTE